MEIGGKEEPNIGRREFVKASVFASVSLAVMGSVLTGPRATAGPKIQTSETWRYKFIYMTAVDEVIGSGDSQVIGGVFDSGISKSQEARKFENPIEMCGPGGTYRIHVCSEGF